MSRHGTVTAALVGVVWLIYLASPVRISTDSRWVIPTAWSLLEEGNTDLDEYLPRIQREGYYGVERVRGSYFMMFPLGTALTTAPLLAGTSLVADRVFDLDLGLRIQQGRTGGVELALASFWVACTAGLLYWIAADHLSRPLPALGAALLFALATSAWSSASRGLWQHGPFMLALLIAIWVALQAERRPRVVPILALPLCLAYVIRPTAAIPILVLSLHVARQHRPRLMRYLLCFLPVAIPFLLYNLWIYRLPLAPYYLPRRVGSGTRFLEALAGNLVSPGRGLLVYSPVLVLAGFGLVLLRRQPRKASLATCLGWIVVLHWGLISTFPHWWGGHSYGPRLFSDVLPILCLMLAVALDRIARLRGARGALLAFLLGLTGAFSLFVHYRGAVHPATREWSTRPEDVDRAPGRLWDWRDPPFLRETEG